MVKIKFNLNFILDADDYMAFAGLPLLFKEKPELLFMIDNTDMDRSMGIRMKTQLITMETDSFIVFVEGTEVCKCDSLFDAYSALLGCIYVMN